MGRNIKENIYNGTSGTLTWLLKVKEPDGQGFLAQDLFSVTEMSLKIGGVDYDSTTYPTAFDWQTANFTGELILTLGGLGISAGAYHNCRLTVTDPTNPNGVVWDNTIFFRVYD